MIVAPHGGVGRLFGAPALSWAFFCLVAGYYLLTTQNFGFFKDDLVNLYYAYAFGWDALLIPAGPRGPAPLYRALFGLIAMVDGAQYALARCIILAWLVAIQFATLHLVRSFQRFDETIAILIAAVITVYPLYFGSVKWTSSAFHLLPILVTLFMAMAAVVERRQPWDKAIRIAGWCVFGALFAPVEAAMIGLSAVAAMAWPDRSVRHLEQARARVFAVAGLIASIVAVSYWIGWDNEARAVVGHNDYDVLLYPIVLVKSILKYSPPALLTGRVLYLESGLWTDLLALVYFVCIGLAYATSPFRVLVRMAVVFGALYTIGIAVGRLPEFGWVIIPEHRYYLIPQLLLWTFVLLHLAHMSTRAVVPGQCGSDERANHRGRLMLLFLTMLLVLSMWRGFVMAERLFYQADLNAIRSSIQTIGLEIASGAFTADDCDRPLPAAIEMPTDHNRQRLFAAYFERGHAICGQDRLPAVGL